MLEVRQTLLSQINMFRGMFWNKRWATFAYECIYRWNICFKWASDIPSLDFNPRFQSHISALHFNPISQFNPSFTNFLFWDSWQVFSLTSVQSGKCSVLASVQSGNWYKWRNYWTVSRPVANMHHQTKYRMVTFKLIIHEFVLYCSRTVNSTIISWLRWTNIGWQ